MAEVNLYRYDFSLIRNFGVESLKKYLKNEIPDFTRLFNLKYSSRSHETICNLLNEQINSGFDDTSIEGTLFQLLVYVIPERSYYFTFSTNLNIDIALEHLNSKFPDIVNMKITKISRQVEHLLTIRKEQSKLVFLFNEGVASLGKTEEKCGFYVACIIDFENNGIEIKLNQHLRRSTGKKVKNIISEVEEFLKRNLSFSTPTESFYFQPNRSNEAFIHKGLYKLFEEESSRSLDLIKRKIAEFEGEEDVEQAEKVLKLNVSKYLEEELHLRSPEPYVNKVLSAKYQDTALIMEEAEFINDGGYIFGFTFVDRKITKSSNKNEENKPVYYSKIFWDLKETVKDYEEICELGVYWKFNKNDFSKVGLDTRDKDNLSYVEVGFKETQHILEIHYYVNRDDGKDFINTLHERRVRRKYVIGKIEKFIYGK